MIKYYYVYIIASDKMGTIYISVTSDLVKRIYEHKNKIIKGFSSKYNINKLVYYEVYQDINEAITREKQLKKWNRNWKLKLIIEKNPQWDDLYSKIVA